MDSSFYDSYSLPDDSGIPGSNEFGHSYFREGNKRIDFILVYINDEVHQQERETFNQILIDAELEIEIEPSVSGRNNIYFVKIHIPDKIVQKNADILGLKFIDRGPSNVVDKLKRLKIPSCMIPDERTDIIISNRPPESLYITRTTDESVHYSDVDRIKVIWNILQHANYVPDQDGLAKLLSYGVYTAAFPLHEGGYKEDRANIKVGSRRLLYTEWARLKSSFLKFQPSELIKHYFGEEIGLHFVWLEYYTIALLFPAIVGIVVFFLDVFYVENEESIPSRDICKSGVMMCPICEHPENCRFVPLNHSCKYAELSYMFDNPATVAWAIILVVWGTVVIELWKRKQSVLSWKWDLNVVEIIEEDRSDFDKKARKTIRNPVTSKKEPYMPLWERFLRHFVSYTGVVLVAIVLCLVYYVFILYRISVSSGLDHSTNHYVEKYKVIFSGVTQYSMVLVVMFIAEQIFSPIAVICTNFEVPRTHLDYYDSFAFKMIFLQFVNYFGVPIYTAFLRGNLFTHPGNRRNYLRLAFDVCDPSGCLPDLFIHISICMGVRQIIVTSYRNIKPFIIKKYRKRFVGVSPLQTLPRWEIDYNLLEYKERDLFRDRLELVLQYGFVTMFGTAFPLAPVFAILYNIFQIRLHAYQLLVVSRRIVPRKVRGLGIWESVLQGITYLSIVTSAFLIAFTSDFIPRVVYKIKNNWDLTGYILTYYLAKFDTNDYGVGSLPFKTCRYIAFRLPPSDPKKYQHSMDFWYVLIVRVAFIIVYEHAVIILVGILAYAIPDVPNSVKQRIALDREQTLKAREARYSKIANEKKED